MPFSQPTAAIWFYLVLVVVCVSARVYAWMQGLSISAICRYGLLQPAGIIRKEGQLAEIESPLTSRSLNLEHPVGAIAPSPLMGRQCWWNFLSLGHLAC